MEEDMMTNVDDSDDDRLDFIDAIDEEITDKVTSQFRKKRRPLKASEIEKISRGNFEGLKDSVLS